MDDGSTFLCPTATSLDLRVNMLSIFILKIMCVTTYLKPGLSLSLSYNMALLPLKHRKQHEH